MIGNLMRRAATQGHFAEVIIPPLAKPYAIIRNWKKEYRILTFDRHGVGYWVSTTGGIDFFKSSPANEVIKKEVGEAWTKWCDYAHATDLDPHGLEVVSD